MACSTLLQALTPQDFKDLFPRDFNYLPVWSNSTFYNINEIVYYSVNRLFYRCLANGTTSVPTTIADWALYPAGNILNYVSDAEITKAFAEACIAFNPALFGDFNDQKLGYLYLAASYLYHDLNAKGVLSVAVFPVNSRSVGNVSESFTVPDWVLKNPITAFLASNSYGLKYLSLTWSKTRGNIVSVRGGTRA